MSDLFGVWVPDEWIDECFVTMALTPWHTHQVLTKRVGRMREYMRGLVRDQIQRLIPLLEALSPLGPEPVYTQPLPNVWLGVSIEDQETANKRISLLLQTPAAVRFLSCEPLLGPLDLALTGTLPGDWTGGAYRLAAWGNHGDPARVAEVLEILRAQRDVHVLGLTQQRSPRHPLRLPGSLTPRRWRSRR